MNTSFLFILVLIPRYCILSTSQEDCFNYQIFFMLHLTLYHPIFILSSFPDVLFLILCTSYQNILFSWKFPVIFLSHLSSALLFNLIYFPCISHITPHSFFTATLHGRAYIHHHTTIHFPFSLYLPLFPLPHIHTVHPSTTLLNTALHLPHNMSMSM